MFYRLIILLSLIMSHPHNSSVNAQQAKLSTSLASGEWQGEGVLFKSLSANGTSYKRVMNNGISHVNFQISGEKVISVSVFMYMHDEESDKIKTFAFSFSLPGDTLPTAASFKPENVKRLNSNISLDEFESIIKSVSIDFVSIEQSERDWRYLTDNGYKLQIHFGDAGGATAIFGQFNYYKRTPDDKRYDEVVSCMTKNGKSIAKELKKVNESNSLSEKEKLQKLEEIQLSYSAECVRTVFDKTEEYYVFLPGGRIMFFSSGILPYTIAINKKDEHFFRDPDAVKVVRNKRYYFNGLAKKIFLVSALYELSNKNGEKVYYNYPQSFDEMDMLANSYGLPGEYFSQIYESRQKAALALNKGGSVIADGPVINASSQVVVKDTVDDSPVVAPALEMDWLKKLPACPCTYGETKNKGKTYYPEGEWYEDLIEKSGIDYLKNKYHFGAKYSVRWIPLEKYKPGQQCTYDENGNLITEGLAAGTPDRVSPGKWGNRLHQKEDIDPWNILSCTEYLSRWPPNQGDFGCTGRKAVVNPFFQLRYFIDSLTCPEITSLFKKFIYAEEPVIAVKQFMQKGKVSTRDEAVFLLEYFRRYLKSGVSMAKYEVVFCTKAINYFEQYLINRPAGDQFRIDSKYVTLSTDKVVKWIKWQDAPADLKIAARFCRTAYGEKYLIDEIEKNLLLGNPETEIAVLDLDNDGICGLAVQFTGSYFCGSRGCTISLYENGGTKYYELGTDYTCYPAKSAIRSSAGLLFPVKRNSNANISEVEIRELEKLFTYDSQKQSQLKQSILKNLIGGSTPEALSKTLLKALQQNDKTTWERCIHPDTRPEVKIELMEWFDNCRQVLQRKGISQWGLVNFSRVTYQDCNSCAPEGEKLLTTFKTEFWYKGKEFLGGFSITRILTYKGKYYMNGCLECDAAVIRNAIR